MNWDSRDNVRVSLGFVQDLFVCLTSLATIIVMTKLRWCPDIFTVSFVWKHFPALRPSQFFRSRSSSEYCD